MPQDTHPGINWDRGLYRGCLRCVMKRIFWLYPQSAAEREEEMCKLEQKNVEIEAWAGRQESAA